METDWQSWKSATCFPSNIGTDGKLYWIQLAEYVGFDIPKSLRVKLLPGRSLSAVLCMDSAHLNPFS